MKAFLHELAKPWRELRAVKYYKSSPRFTVKRVLVRINSEAVTGVRTVKMNFLFDAFGVLVLVGGVFLILNLDYVGVSGLLTKGATCLIGVVSILFTVALFVSTISMQATKASSEKDVRFMKNIRSKYDDAQQVLGRNMQKDPKYQEDVALLLSAMVCSQADYNKFKSWYIARRDALFAGNPQLKYPYEICQYAARNRPNIIKNSADSLVARTQIQFRDKRELLEKLESLASDYSAWDGSNIYTPRQLIDYELTRVLFYSFASVLLAGIGYVLASIRGGNSVHTWLLDTFFVFAICVMAVTIYLITRYVSGFVSYIRNSGRYAYSQVYNVQAYEQDGNMCSPASPFRGGLG